jgi:broad specificity phosphatase PhoE
MKQIAFIRHGETLDNARGIAQGWRDSALTELGEKQVALAAGRVSQLAPTSLFSSTLPRALATAAALAKILRLEVQPLEELREMNCGEWEGQAFLDVRSNEPDLFRRWTEDPTVACPGGESLHDVRLRMERAVALIAAADSGEAASPLVVSHGTAIRVVATALLELPLETARRLAQDNAAVNLFEWRGDRWVLRYWNDASHCRTEGTRQ